MNKVLATGFTVAALCTAPAVLAYEAGDMVIRAGAATVEPHEDSGHVTTSLGGIGKTSLKAGVDSDTQLGLTFTYMLSDQLGVGVLAATPFEHTLALTNGFGGIDMADIKHLPPTVTLQYYFNENNNRWQPYLGAGINYTTFFDEEFKSSFKSSGFSNLELDDSWGWALEAGMDYSFSDNLLLSAQVWYLDIDTRADFKLFGANSYVDLDIDPWVYMVGIGYKF